MKKAIKSLFRKYWVEGLLVACLVSSFSVPAVNVGFLLGALGIFATRLIYRFSRRA